MKNTDDELVEQSLGGASAAYDELVSRHLSAVFTHVRIMVHDDATAEDIVQESFIKAYEKLASFNPKKAQFKTWLFTIATRKALDVLRKKPTVDVDDVVLESTLPSPKLRAEQREVRDAVQSLEPKQRAVVSLYFWHGYDYQAISKTLKAPVGSIKGWMHRAKQVLKGKLS